MVQLVNYRRNGDAFVNYLSVTPIHNDAGVLTHYVGIQSDITELVNHKKAELAAKHAAVQVRSCCRLQKHGISLRRALCESRGGVRSWGPCTQETPRNLRADLPSSSATHGWCTGDCKSFSSALSLCRRQLLQRPSRSSWRA